MADGTREHWLFDNSQIDLTWPSGLWHGDIQAAQDPASVVQWCVHEFASIQAPVTDRLYLSAKVSCSKDNKSGRQHWQVSILS